MTPQVASGRAWIAPVTGVFATVGSERIANMGSPALTALSTLDASARYPFASAPQAIDLLAENLMPYATPETFASMPAEDKLIALRAAAKSAEGQAAAVADKSLAEAKSQPLHPDSVDQVSKQVAQAEEIALYLDAPRQKELARMRSIVTGFQAKWRKRVKAFEDELPGKIAAGAFDSSNILVKTEHGWVAADESPYPIKTSLPEFFARRTQALAKAPLGSWTMQEALLLQGALARPDIGDDQKSKDSWSRTASEKLQNVFYSAKMRDGSDLVLQDALYAFELKQRYGRIVPPRVIMFVEQRYSDLIDSLPQSIPIRLRMLASMLNGADTLPSWERFAELQQQTLSVTRHKAMIAAGFVIGGMTALALLSSMLGAWPLAAKLAALALGWLAPMTIYVRGLLRAMRLETPQLRWKIGLMLGRTFPRD
ncbi:MAG: hypothetical protein A2506_09465 [Elusimicrobia bacterium RIFOXYD12_FULL_66_9]|nr:MAG: hypothetical protein A2506_09465 [Elusimicrobia bacterium RIFOXYD12_FULL_66_9]